jgi:hypothetical protein
MVRLFLAVSIFFAGVLPAFAHSGHDRVAIGSSITVDDGDTSGDIACMFCAVRVHGDVKGDIAVMFGSITVDSGRNVSGDVAGLGANLALGEGAEIAGDVAIAGADATLAPGAMIHGDKAIAPNRLWMLLPFAPLLILAGIVWLIIYIVRRNRYQFPAYPNGRRY